MAVSYQLVIDCRDPEPLALFWAEALHYVLASPPSGFATWDDFLRSIGVPEGELGRGPDRIEDPNGEGPSIWFQVVSDRKSVKNRIHIDVHASREGGPFGAGGTPASRRARVEAEAERLVELGATRLRALTDEASDHYAVAMTDPEGNEFDIN